MNNEKNHTNMYEELVILAAGKELVAQHISPQGGTFKYGKDAEGVLDAFPKAKIVTFDKGVVLDECKKLHFGEQSLKMVEGAIDIIDMHMAVSGKSLGKNLADYAREYDAEGLGQQGDSAELNMQIEVIYETIMAQIQDRGARM